MRVCSQVVHFDKNLNKCKNSAVGYSQWARAQKKPSRDDTVMVARLTESGLPLKHSQECSVESGTALDRQVKIVTNLSTGFTTSL